MGNAVATRDMAHDLVERIDPEKVPLAVEFLEKLADPVSFALAHAPFEDEDVDEAEELSAARSRAETGPGTLMEELLAEFGMTLDELRGMDLSASARHGQSAD